MRHLSAGLERAAHLLQQRRPLRPTRELRPLTTRPPLAPADRDVGVSLIVAYKLIKGGLMLAAGVSLYVALLAGATEHLHQYAAILWNHVASSWSLVAARLLFQVTAPNHLRLVIAAMLLDGLLSLCEGWTLHRRYRWAPWLIVGATGSLLPFEVIELVRGMRIGRLVVFAVNLAAVLYLVRRALRHHRSPH